MIEVYRGSPNAWETDEMGHMNVRFYLAKLMEGIGVFCSKTGMPNAFKSNAPSTVKLKELHVRFVKEAHAGVPIFMQAGVIETHVSSAKIYMQLNHLDGSPCAVFRFELEHVDIHTGQAFLWSPKTAEIFKSIPAVMPEILAPRSIPMDAPPKAPPTMDDVTRIGSIQIGTGMIMPDQCDVFGNMRTEYFIGKVSDSAPHLADALEVDMTRSPRIGEADGKRIGTAALEYRFAFQNLPRSGDCYNIYAGLAHVTGKTWGTFYWFMDPVTHMAYATLQATLIRFDLDTRKSIMPPPDAFEIMQRAIPQGMWL